MPSGAAVPPRSLQHPSAQSPAWLSLAPRNPGLGLSLRGRAWPRFFSALPFKAYPGCQPHAEQRALPSALDCVLTRSSLVLHHPWASGPHVT